MNRFPLLIVLTAGGLMGTALPHASAQIIYRRTNTVVYPRVTTYSYGQTSYYRPVAPAPWPGQYVAPAYPANPYPAGYASPPPAPLGNDAASYIRSLYLQNLNREPEPQGLAMWTNRLIQSGGNTDQITREFLQAAQVERSVNSGYPAPQPYYP